MTTQTSTVSPVCLQPQPFPAGCGRSAQQAREFLAFELGHVEYGIDYRQVQAVLPFEHPIPREHAQHCILGGMNWRGAIVPLWDLRIWFGTEDVNYDSSTKVLVLDVGHQAIGVVVDKVSVAVTLEPGQLHPAPRFSGGIELPDVWAIGSKGGRMWILLNIENMVQDIDWGPWPAPARELPRQEAP